MKPRRHFALEIAGRKVRLGQRTLVMGVLNVTPDSFSDGGRYVDPKRAVEHGLELARQGADWIDVGGESTRPGSKPVPAEEELRRVLPVIQALSKKLRGVPISIDTTKAEVAEAAVRAGASIVNDVSGLRFDACLAAVARRHSTPLILMHIRGKPATMQQKPFASSIWRSVRERLEWSIRRARAAGLRRSQLIIDPGLGFGKSRRQNFEILAQLGRLRKFRLPILVGTSRKSFVRAVVEGEGLEPSEPATFKEARAGLGDPWSAAPDARRRGRKAADLEDTAALRLLPSLQFGDAAAVAASILAGAHIVRVHDVAAVLPAVRIADAVLKAASSE